VSALQDIAFALEAERVGAAAPADVALPVTPSRLRNWFEHLSIGGKVTLFFSINLGFALLAGLFVVGGYIELGQRADGVRRTHDEALRAERLLVQLGQAQRHSEMLAVSGSSDRAQAARDALDDAESGLAELAQMIRTANPEAYGELAALRRAVADLDRQMADLGPGRQERAASLAAASAGVVAQGEALAQRLSDDAAAKADGSSAHPASAGDVAWPGHRSHGHHDCGAALFQSHGRLDAQGDGRADVGDCLRRAPR
jgi:methyl-accepting chemotaxis protein